MQKQMLDETKKNINEAKKRPGFAGNFALNDASEVGVEYARLLVDFETY